MRFDTFEGYKQNIMLYCKRNYDGRGLNPRRYLYLFLCQRRAKAQSLFLLLYFCIETTLLVWYNQIDFYNHLQKPITMKRCKLALMLTTRVLGYGDSQWGE